MTEDLTKQVEAAIKEFHAQYASGETAKKKSPERQPVAV
jgi:hypothetical protein